MTYLTFFCTKQKWLFKTQTCFKKSSKCHEWLKRDFTKVNWVYLSWRIMHSSERRNNLTLH